MDFLEKLNQLMAQNKIKISELSRQSGIPYTTIDGFYKKGYQNIKLSTLKQLSDFFHVSLDYLARDELENPVLDEGEEALLMKYRMLDEFGKRKVDSVAESEYITVMRIRRKPAAEKECEVVELPFYEDKAAAGTGYMLNDNGYEMMRVVRTRETDRADFVVTVSGASMEPEFHDGDHVLVRSQPDVYEGEIGIFVVNGDGFIKKKGKNRLISLNRNYRDIVLYPYDTVSCAGKVIGKLAQEDILFD